MINWSARDLINDVSGLPKPTNCFGIDFVHHTIATHQSGHAASACAQLTATASEQIAQGAKIREMDRKLSGIEGALTVRTKNTEEFEELQRAENARLANLIKGLESRHEASVAVEEAKTRRLEAKLQDLMLANSVLEERRIQLAARLNLLREMSSHASFFGKSSTTSSVMDGMESNPSFLAGSEAQSEAGDILDEELERLMGESCIPTEKTVDIDSPSGMPNIGNSCYIASTVQALIASPTLLKKLNAPLIKKSTETEAQYKEREAIQTALKALIQSTSDFTLSNFRQAVFDNQHFSKELSSWKNGEQKAQSPIAGKHDAAELMMLLLNVIDYHVELQELWWVADQPLPDAPVVQCNPLIDIEITGEKSLQSLIDEAFALRQRSDAANQRDLIKDNIPIGTFANWFEQLRLANRPEVVVIHLKRFTNTTGQITKIATPVSLPENLMMDLKGAFANPTENDMYRLVSTVRHTEQVGGHYIAHVDRQGWKECNDSLVAPVNELQDSHTQNYLLLFERVN